MPKCAWHCCQSKTTETSKFCSKQCKNKFYVNTKRKRTKTKAIEYKGGKCEKCGYSKCNGALQFHHRDPKSKEFGIADYGYTRSWERTQKELDKCMLLCSNCHAEEHETNTNR